MSNTDRLFSHKALISALNSIDDSVKAFHTYVKENVLLYLLVVAASSKVSSPVADVTGLGATRHKVAHGE